MKYVMLEVALGNNGRDKQRIPIIFPDFMIHKEVVKHMSVMLRRVHNLDATIHSAGSIQLSATSCHGDSETLAVQADLQSDREVIDTYDYFHGLVSENETSVD